MNKTVIREWLTPAGVALVAGVIVSYTAFRADYTAMAAQVNTNTEAVSKLTKSLDTLSKDKIAELKGRLAVLQHIASNGGLNEGQRIEMQSIRDRLKDLQ
jgi:uncharacterized membrane-anchored protein YhcB (DUF1043 family)